MKQHEKMKSNFKKSKLGIMHGVCMLSFLLLLLAACTENDSDVVDETIDPTAITIGSDNTTGTAEGDTNNTAADEDDLVANSTFSSTVLIEFNGTSANITNPLDGSGVTITQDNGHVTVDATVSEVAYEISGTTSSGSLKIYSSKKLKLTLNGVSITSNTGPAINIQTSKTIFVVLADGTTNSLTDVATYSGIPEDEDAKAAFFSEGQLVFSGTGTLSVNGKYKHGIVSDDYIRVISGTITVNEAVKDAIHTNDYFIADGGTFNLTADSDGIDCEEGYIIINDGTFTCNTADDGIAASYDIDDEEEPDESITPYVTINSGTFTINSSAGEGIESKSVMTINGGTFTINTYDDGLNAIEDLYINGGNIYIKATNNDAVDANGNLTITGGIIVAIGSGAPEGAFDNDNNTFKITGGTLLGIGGTTSTPTANACSQYSVILGNYTTSSLIHIRSTDGTEALTFQVPQSYATMLYSSAKLQSNTSYKIYTGGSISNGVDFHGLYTGGTYSNGTTTSAATFTTTSKVTQLGGSTGPGGGF